MWTVSYKGFFIHGYVYKPETTYHREGEKALPAGSLHAAKIRISKRLKREQTK